MFVAVDGRLVVRVVEDDPIVVEMLRVWLDDDVALLVTADHFGETLLPGAWEDVDVAVVDFMLPGLSGDVVLRYLTDVHPMVRRVVFSAVGGLGLIDEGLADAVVTKPARREELLHAIGVDSDR